MSTYRSLTTENLLNLDVALLSSLKVKCDGGIALIYGILLMLMVT